YGLGCSLWGDEERARALADRPRCGTVWINTHGVLRHDVPFGGHRDSGIGVEYGPWGLHEYTQLKVRHIALRQADREMS
ncbi:aldehyde dehydrogenase family protein, partial [Streptomyces sp. NPDC056626]